jgi:predicted nucleic acid-binding protein
MIVVDTNIVSEVMRPQPDTAVIQWLDQQETSLLYLTTITLAEIRYGLGILPDGERKQRLINRFEAYVDRAFEGRILDFTADAASRYADIMTHRRKVGLPMSMADGQIAAIASAHHFAVATQNTKDFEQCGLELINPFVMG